MYLIGKPLPGLPSELRQSRRMRLPDEAPTRPGLAG